MSLNRPQTLRIRSDFGPHSQRAVLGWAARPLSPGRESVAGPLLELALLVGVDTWVRGLNASVSRLGPVLPKPEAQGKHRPQG